MTADASHIALDAGTGAFRATEYQNASGSVINPFTPGAAVANITGSMTGTTDGVIADVAAIALSTSNTYSDAAVNTAVNTAITSTNLQIKEVLTKLNALLTSVRTAGFIS